MHDRDALVINLDSIARCLDKDGHPAMAGIVRDAIALLKEQEAVATDTNVLGKWIRLTGMAPPEHHGHKICSVCNCLAQYDPIHQWREVLSPYCPSCGAKMEVQKTDDRKL